MPGFHIISLQVPFDYNCFVSLCKISALKMYLLFTTWNFTVSNQMCCCFSNYWISTAVLGGLHLGNSFISYSGKEVHWGIWAHEVRKGQIPIEQYISGKHLVNGLLLHNPSLLLFPARWCVKFISGLLDREKGSELLWGCISSPTLLYKDFGRLFCELWSGSFSEFSLLLSHRGIF